MNNNATTLKINSEINDLKALLSNIIENGPSMSLINAYSILLSNLKKDLKSLDMYTIGYKENLKKMIYLDNQFGCIQRLMMMR